MPDKHLDLGSKHLDFNDLSVLERERLVLLVEEMTESIHIMCKILRFGYNDYSPVIKPVVTNRTRLEEELGHVKAALELITHHEDVDAKHIDLHKLEKLQSLHKWLIYDHDLENVIGQCN